MLGQAREVRGEEHQQDKLLAVTPQPRKAEKLLFCAGWEEMLLTSSSNSGMALGLSC